MDTKRANEFLRKTGIWDDKPEPMRTNWNLDLLFLVVNLGQMGGLQNKLAPLHIPSLGFADAKGAIWLEPEELQTWLLPFNSKISQ